MYMLLISYIRNENKSILCFAGGRKCVTIYEMSIICRQYSHFNSDLQLWFEFNFLYIHKVLGIIIDVYTPQVLWDNCWLPWY